MHPVLLVLLALLATASPALADIYTLNYANFTRDGGPFGTVELTQNGDTVHVAVELASGLLFVNAGFAGSFDFNLIDDPTVTFSNITSGWTSMSSSAGNYKFDGVGNFEYGLTCTACGSGGSNPPAGILEFDVTASGLTTGSFMELSDPHGYYFGADVIDYNIDRRPTGAIAANSVSVPEPGSMTLLVLFAPAVALFALWAQPRRPTEE